MADTDGPVNKMVTPKPKRYLSKSTFEMVTELVKDAYADGLIDYSEYIKWSFMYENLLDDGMLRKGHHVMLQVEME